ncbi:MAG: SDR family NAD(P)-dependent oxidoreductase, partial [Caldilineaceae bacterium]|nr:SDR family NAD(P)-dependent oxidoreductase [Caldilineaceae bacterium]
RGIGAATATAFAREGAQVVICDVMAEQGKEFAESLNDHYADGRPAAIFVPVDVTSANSVTNLVQQTLAAFGRLDILVNNAGITRDAQLRKMGEE